MQQQGKAAGVRVPELPGFVQKWVAFTSPVHSRQPQWREEIASLIFPVVFLLVIMPLPAALNNPAQLITLAIVAPVMLIALLLKKLGHFLIAGFFITAGIECGLASALLALPGGVDVAQLPLYALFIQTGFVVIAFFSPGWIWIIAIINSAFTVVTLTNSHMPDSTLEGLLAKDPAALIIPMVLLQLFVALVCWVIMSALIRAITRADMAEKVAELEHSVRLQQEEQLEVSRQIEVGIEQILTVLNTAATNTDFSARVPLSQENILWRIGRALNNLLARLQGLRNTSQELEKTRAVAAQLTEILRQRRTFSFGSWTGTCLDPVIIEVNKLTSGSPSSAASSTPPSALPPTPKNPLGASPTSRGAQGPNRRSMRDVSTFDR